MTTLQDKYRKKKSTTLAPKRKKEFDHEVIDIPVRDKIVRLHFHSFENDIDVDDLTKIHYDNIIGEVLTVSVLMNRVGILRAEAEDALAHGKMSRDICEAQLQEYYRKQKTIKLPDLEGKGKSKWYKPTIDEINAAVLQDLAFQNQQKTVFRLQKEFGYVEALYWAVQSKDKKLNKLSEKLKPEEFETEIAAGVINGIQITIHDKLIKG